MAKLPKDLEEAQKKAEAFEETVKDLTLDRCNEAAKVEEEPQTKLSQQELSKKKEIYLKPKRSFSCKGKFNEKFRDDYEFKKEYVCFIAENREIIGETISLWTKPFPGVACEEWEVPTNKPVWGPRYLAERIKGCSYHRFTMQQTNTGTEGNFSYYGSMVVDSTIQRLDAIPANEKRSVFMGAQGF